jgi:hypothetical protein
LASLRLKSQPASPAASPAPGQAIGEPQARVSAAGLRRPSQRYWRVPAGRRAGNSVVGPVRLLAPSSGPSLPASVTIAGDCAGHWLSVGRRLGDHSGYWRGQPAVPVTQATGHATGQSRPRLLRLLASPAGRACDSSYWPVAGPARLLAHRVRAASATIPGAGGSGWIEDIIKWIELLIAPLEAGAGSNH